MAKLSLRGCPFDQKADEPEGLGLGERFPSDRGGVPDLHRRAVPCSKPGAVGAECYAAAPSERERLVAGCDVPDLDGPVADRGGEAGAVGAVRHAPDPAVMPLQSEGRLTGGGVPDPDGRIADRGGEAVAAGAVRHANDGT